MQSVWPQGGGTKGSAGNGVHLSGLIATKDLSPFFLVMQPGHIKVQDLRCVTRSRGTLSRLSPYDPKTFP